MKQDLCKAKNLKERTFSLNKNFWTIITGVVLWLVALVSALHVIFPK